jgi:hypothetical protein
MGRALKIVTAYADRKTDCDHEGVTFSPVHVPGIQVLPGTGVMVNTPVYGRLVGSIPHPAVNV